MSIQATIKRLSLIIELVSAKYKPTKQEILEYLKNEGFKIDSRTLSRHFAILRDEFGIYLDFIQPGYRYFINEEKSININSTLHLFNISNTALLITKSLRESKETLSHVAFEYEGNQTGIHHLAKILEAIREQKVICIHHKKFGTPGAFNYTFLPYLLKQFQGRWYIIGQTKSNKKWRSFALDRIEKIEKLTKKFVRDESVDIKVFFDNYVGVSFIDKAPEAVQLWVHLEQVKYFETLPLHSSQLEINKDEKGIIYAYHLVPTYEFIQKILKDHCYVKVLKPEWLRNEVVRLLKKAVENYK